MLQVVYVMRNECQKCEVRNKIFDVSGSAITVVLNTKIRVVENKISDISELKKQHIMMLK